MKDAKVEGTINRFNIMVRNASAKLEGMRKATKDRLGEGYEKLVEPYRHLVLQQMRRTKKGAVESAYELIGLVRGSTNPKLVKMKDQCEFMLISAALDVVERNMTLREAMEEQQADLEHSID